MLTDIRIRLFLAFIFYSWDQRTGYDQFGQTFGQMKASLSIMIVVRKTIRKRVARTLVRYIQNSGWLKNFPSFRSPNWLFLGFQKLIKNWIKKIWIKKFGSKNSDKKFGIKKFESKILDHKFGNLGSVVPWTYQGIVSSVFHFLLPTVPHALPSVYCIPPLLQPT